MRISTAQYYETTAANYQRNFNKAIATSAEASSLVRINTAADDPIGAGRLLQLGQQSALLDQYNGNISSIKSTLSLSETTLTSIGTALQRAKEIALSANNGNATDADRQAYAAELSQIQEQVLGLMNSQDSSGNYLFAGSKTDTPPYSRNSDGTYSYNGDQSTLDLAIGDSLSVASNTTGWAAFQQAINTSRTQSNMTAPADDGRVTLSNGQIGNSATYNASFAGGEPYTVSFLSSTQLQITDVLGNDVTAEATQNGVISNSNGANQVVSFRGVNLNLNINLQPTDTNPDAVIAGHSFQLSAKPDTFNTSRSPGNPSTAVITGAAQSNAAAYNSTFPSGGAILKFTSATAYDLYASPLTADSRPVSSGTMAGSTATAAGVAFTLSGTPAAGDQFVVQANTHQTQNVLDTLGQMTAALNTPVDNDTVAKQRLLATMDSGISNLTSATDQLAVEITSVGVRAQALEDQSMTNQSLVLANTTTQSSIRDSDPAEVMTRLTLQQTMLQAAQLAFSKITQLGLFNKI